MAHDVTSIGFGRRLKYALSSPGTWVVGFATVWLVALVFTAIFADLIAPFGYAEQSLFDRLKPPAFQGGPEGYLLGTHHLGRDLLSRLIYAIRISVAIAVLGA